MRVNTSTLPPICNPEFEAHGIDRWCKHNGNTFLIGVAFQQESVIFGIRMVEQVCHIESYRNKILAETGIQLTPVSKLRDSGFPIMRMSFHNY